MKVPIVPTGTYLETTFWDLYASQSTKLYLRSLWWDYQIDLRDGDEIALSVDGGYMPWPFAASESSRVGAVFVDDEGSFLYPGLGTIVSPVWTQPVDIPYDFEIGPEPQRVRIPEGAVAVLFTTLDLWYSNNHVIDPSQGFDVKVVLEVKRRSPTPWFDLSVDSSSIVFKQIVLNPRMGPYDEYAYNPEDQSSHVWANMEANYPISLIAGRAASVEADIHLYGTMPSPEVLGPEAPEPVVTLGVDYIHEDNSVTILDTVELSPGDFTGEIGWESYHYRKVFDPAIFGAGRGQIQFSAIANYTIEEVRTGNNYGHRQIIVHKTKPILVGLYSIVALNPFTMDPCRKDQVGISCFLPPHPGSYEFLEQEKELIQKVFPIPDNGVTLFGATFRDVAKQSIGLDNHTWDMSKLSLIAKKIKSDYGGTRNVYIAGVVDRSYIQYHAKTSLDEYYKHEGWKSVLGYSQVGLEGIIVVPSASNSLEGPAFVPGSLVHELGHVFGTKFHSNDPRVVSYTRKERNVVAGYEFTAEGEMQARFGMVSIMESAFEGDPLQDLWIDPFSYGAMLRYLKWPWYDPELVVVNGVMSKDGDFSLVDSIQVSHGDLMAYPDSEFEFVARNHRGEVVYHNNMVPDFQMFVGGFEEPIELNYAPVSISFPNLSEIDSIEVSKGGFVTYHLDVKQQGLRAAFDHIPDSGFRVRNRRLIRLIREQMSHRVDKYLFFKERGKKYQARKELWLLKKIVEKVVRDHYEPESPLDIGKSEVLSVIEDTVLSIRNWE
ncbi:MAG: hypothetical protein KDD68_01720 [Bdellovibrionales bacterium]|nr:hypothetical protein [Bdellovibrionales bacterium]